MRTALDWLYNQPHYYYEVRTENYGVRTEYKTVFGSVDQRAAEKIYEETQADCVELVRLNHGNFDKVIKSKEIE